MHPPATRRRVAALLCAGVLTMAACGSNGDDVSAPDTDAPATAAPVTDTPVTATPETSTTETETETETPDTGVPAAVETTPDASTPVPDILQVSAPVVGGGELDLADYADRPLLLWFWAPF